VTNKKSNGKARASSSNVVSVSSKEIEESVASLIDARDEKFVLAMDQDAPSTSKTHSGKQYLKKCEEAVASLPKSTKETTEQSEATPGEAVRAPLYESSSERQGRRIITPIHFDILAQLANIPAWITLYELLKLSKSTKEAFREALVDLEAFIAQIPAMSDEKDNGHYYQTSKCSPCITFTRDDM